MLHTVIKRSHSNKNEHYCTTHEPVQHSETSTVSVNEIMSVFIRRRQLQLLLIPTKLKTLIHVCRSATHPDCEVTWSTVNVAWRCQWDGDMFYGHFRHHDGSGQLDDQVSLAAIECPTFTRLYTRLSHTTFLLRCTVIHIILHGQFYYSMIWYSRV